ncbi:MAG TPA: glycosyltransferase, exosortase A system-associated [Gammaproteobacteria bacterium]|nr:glycosyltransferase, exosortase A system-associated [Gammaproteobacteria bacterium]
MRILHILDHSIPLHSGYTFRTRNILDQQRALGWETFHLTGPKHQLAAPEAPAEEEVEGFHFYRTPYQGGGRDGWPVVGQMAQMNALTRRLEEVVLAIRPDILHAHSPVLNALPALNIGQRLGLPVVYEIRAFWEDAAVDHGTARPWGLRYRLSRLLETYAIKRAAAVTTICEGLRREIIGRGVAGDKVTVIPNAVDTSKFSLGGAADPALVQALGLQDKRVLGFIGSFYAYEGLGLLLDAVPQIIAANRQAHVLLVGGGPEEAKLKGRVRELGIERHVTFTGRVPHDQVQRYYDLVDVFVYPRLSMRLTELVTPLKPLEAMAQGRLVLASDVGGHRELIRDGDNGCLFKPGNSDALASAVLTLFDDTASCEEIKRNAREYVENVRNWSVSVSRYADVYRALGTN